MITGTHLLTTGLRDLMVERQKLMTQAVSNYLGSSDWDESTLNERCQLVEVTVNVTKVLEMRMDDITILVIYPPEINSFNNHTGEISFSTYYEMVETNQVVSNELH